MKKLILILPALAALSLVSCKKESNSVSKATSDSATTVIHSDSTQTSTPDVAPAPADSAAVKDSSIVKAKSTNAEGKSIDMTFDNEKNTATIVYEGETIELKGQPTGSGIHYKNDHWDLRGKGLENQLLKDGKVVFKGVK